MFVAEVNALRNAGPDVIGTKMSVTSFQDLAVTGPSHWKIALKLAH